MSYFLIYSNIFQNIFLNSSLLYLTQVRPVLRQIVRRIIRMIECIGYSEVGSNQGSTQKLVLFHKIFFICLCLRAPSLHTAVYIISVSQALIRMAQRPPEVEDRLCQFCRFFVSVFGFVSFSKQHLPIDNSNNLFSNSRCPL